jgi:hypothetical protein
MVNNGRLATRRDHHFDRFLSRWIKSLLAELELIVTQNDVRSLSDGSELHQIFAVQCSVASGPILPTNIPDSDGSFPENRLLAWGKFGGDRLHICDEKRTCREQDGQGENKPKGILRTLVRRLRLAFFVSRFHVKIGNK